MYLFLTDIPGLEPAAIVQGRVGIHSDSHYQPHVRDWKQGIPRLLTFGKISPCSWCRDRSWQRPALHSKRSCKRKLSAKEYNYKVYLGEHPKGSLQMKRVLEKGWGAYGLSLTFSLYASSFIWVPVVWQRVDWLSSPTATDEADIVTYSRYSLSYYIDNVLWWKAVGWVDVR